MTLDGEAIGPIGPDDADVARFKVAFASDATVASDAHFMWACDDLRGRVDDPLGPACGDKPLPGTDGIN